MGGDTSTTSCPGGEPKSSAWRRSESRTAASSGHQKILPGPVPAFPTTLMHSWTSLT